MKVLHILAQLPCGTGSGVYFTNLIRELERYKHDQRAVFALQDNHEFQQLPAGQCHPVRFKTNELPFPVPGMSDVMPYDSTKYCDMNDRTMDLWRRAFRRTLEQAAADFQPDVLVLHHLWILTSLALEVFPKARSIGICHHTDLRQARLNPGLKECHVTNINRLDAILSLSDVHQEEIREIHPCDRTGIITVGGGSDSALFFPPPAKRTGGPVKILYAGKIDPSKGVFALIEAFLSLRKKEPDIQLSIVGTPTREYEADLTKLAAEDSGIRLYPSIPQPQLAQMMREHDIFALPSFYEGLGLIAVEALACGLWTVATSIEGLMSLLGQRVRQSGIIEFVDLPPLAPGDIPQGSQMRDFINNLATKLSRQTDRARRGDGFPDGLPSEIAKHSWEGIASRINAVINNE